MNPPAPQDLEKSFLDAIRKSESTRDIPGMIDSYLGIASLYVNKLNRFEEGCVYCNKILDMDTDPFTKAIACSVKSAAKMALGQYHEAMGYSKEAITFTQMANIPAAEMSMQYSLAAVLYLMGRHDEAMDAYEQILVLCDRLGDKKQKILSLMGIAGIKQEQSYFEEALALLDDAKDISENLQDKQLIADCLRAQGVIFLYKLHAMDEAGKCYAEAYSLCESSDDTTDIYRRASALLGLSDISLKENDINKALEYAHRALREYGDSDALIGKRADILSQIAEIYSKQRMYQEAEESIEKALDAYKSSGMARNEADTYRNLASIQLGFKKNDKALASCQKSIDKYHEIGLDYEALTSKIAMVQILYDSGSYGEAKALLEKMIPAIETDDMDPIQVAYCYAGLGLLYRKADDEKSACKYFEAALKKQDSIRSGIISGDMKLYFQGYEDSIIGALVSSLIAINDYNKSFEYVDVSKSRVLSEQLKTLRIGRPSQINELMALKEERLLDEANALINKGMSGPNTSEHIQKAKALDTELNKLWEEMKNACPGSLDVEEYLSLRKGDSFSLNDALDMVNADGRTAVVEYFLLKEKLLIYTLVPGSTEVELHEVPINREAFNINLHSMLDLIANRSPVSKLKPGIDYMSLCLLDPIRDRLGNVEHLTIIPHSLIHKLPIHALQIDDKPLIDRYSVSYSPSASILRYSMKKTSNGTGKSMVIGNPTLDLIYAEREAARIAEILGNDAFLREDASRSKVLSGMPDKDIITFACHASFLGGKQALSSYIKLSGKDRLTARDILKVKAAADLVVLSACESGQSEEMPGDEMFGLVRSFLFSGVKSVMASLWPVDDLATYITMSKFFENYWLKKHTKSDSLRKAQAYLKEMTMEEAQEISKGMPELARNVRPEVPERRNNDTVYSHPYYWSPFIIIGDWR